MFPCSITLCFLPSMEAGVHSQLQTWASEGYSYVSLLLKGTSQHTANTRTQPVWLKGSLSDLQYTLHNILRG